MPTTYRPAPEPPREVLEYFERKQLRPSFNWRDVWGEEHAHAFTVAKSAGFDILEDVRDAVRDALAEGKTFDQFRDELEPILRAKGWWGKRRLTDPKTGEPVIAQLGSPRRLKIIFEANVRSARAAGQWQRAQRTKAVLPYFEYRLGPSEVHRPHHMALEYTVLPVDDTFWNTHFPPNGWGCKCWVRQITERAARERSGVTPRPEVSYREYENYRRRDVGPEQIPVGIDPGWHTNPGRARMAGALDRLTRQLDEQGPEAAKAAISEFWQGPWAAAIRTITEGASIYMPLAVSTAVQSRLQARSPVLAITQRTANAKQDKRALEGTTLDAGTFAQVQGLFDDPVEIISGPGRPGFAYVVGPINGRPWMAVVKMSGNGFMRVQSLHPVHDRRLRNIRQNVSGE